MPTNTGTIRSIALQAWKQTFAGPPHLTAKAMRDFSERHSLHVCEPQRRFELRFEDPVFGNKILIT